MKPLSLPEKSILPHGEGHRRVRRPLESIASKKRQPFMTLIVAAKSKTAVVMAADSQISFGHSALRTDIQKIERVEFQNFTAAVALADSLTSARRYIAILRGMAAHCSPQTADDVGIVVQRAMEQLRRETRHTYQDETKETDVIINEKGLNCSMIVGFCLDYAPHIICTSLITPRYDLSTAEYETDGCGATLANFILAEYFTPKSDVDRTALIAIYAVWAVIKYDRYCKGPIVVWIACPPGGLNNDGKPRVLQFSPDRVNDLISIVETIDSTTKETRRSVINEQFETRRQEFLDFIAREVASLPAPTEDELRERMEEIEHERRNPRPDNLNESQS